MRGKYVLVLGVFDESVDDFGALSVRYFVLLHF